MNNSRTFSRKAFWCIFAMLLILGSLKWELHVGAQSKRAAAATTKGQSRTKQSRISTPTTLPQIETTAEGNTPTVVNGGCSLSCPANISTGNDANQCGAVVFYAAPTSAGTCGTITCSPASGSFFPIGTSTVTCAESGGAACGFTVTVNDTQAPTITCPANISVPNPPGASSVVVNYSAPTVSDNCPGVTAPTCIPASGSSFPIGVTTVTCNVGSAGGCTNAFLTQSTSQAITNNNSVSCNDGFGHTDNSYWRAFNLPSFGINTTFHVASVDVGVELASSGGPIANGPKSPAIAPNLTQGNSKRTNAQRNGPAASQPITIRIYNNTGGAFPGGTRNLLATANLSVADQTGTIVNFPVAANVPAGSEMVVEVFTPDGTAAGNLFFIGSNTAPETAPSYLSAPACGVTNPTPVAAIGFPNMHIVMNVHGCADSAPALTSSCNFKVTVAPPRYWTTTGATGTTDEDSGAIVSHDDFAVQLKDGVTGLATVRYNITAVRGITAFCPATTSTVNVRFRNSDNTGAAAQVRFEIHRTNISAGGNDIIYSFNSNGVGTGASFTTVTATPNIDFEFGNNIYWIEATVFRSSAAQFADLGSIQIFESAGTPCP